MRFTRRPDEPTTIRSREQLTIARPPETVMAFLFDPRSAVLLGDHVERCFHAPDTPVRAVGEQHVIVMRTAGPLQVEVEEVVELDFPHRVVTVSRTTPGDVTTTYTCAARPGGATAYVQEVRVRAARRTAPSVQALFDAHTAESAARLKEVLEGREWTPTGEG